jgi:hypothetical protein
VPMLAIAMKTAMEKLDVPPPPPGTPGPLSRPTREAIGGLLEGGGFSGVEVQELEVNFDFGSPEDYTTFVREIAPPISAMIAPHPAEVQKETWDAITEAAGKTAESDGQVRNSNLVLIAAGQA